MKPTAIWITGTYDAHVSQPELGTNFTPCRLEDATHVSVYLVSDEEAEPVQDFPINGDQAKARVDALMLASSMQDLPIKNTFIKTAPAKQEGYPRVELVRGHKHTCANVQPGSAAADVCDCGAVVDGKAVPADSTVPTVTYFARLLGKAKWEAVSKAEFESYQMGSLYETKTEPVCDAATWYNEAMAASNELGYAGMDAASVIRHLGETVTAFKEAHGKVVDQLQKVTEVDRCECCSELFLGVSKDTKYCPFCGTKHKGETAKVSFTGDPATPFQPTLTAEHIAALTKLRGDLANTVECLDGATDLGALQASVPGALADTKAQIEALVVVLGQKPAEAVQE
jgi:hypothetical protein